MFYPTLTRREKYTINKNGVYHSNYRDYYNEIKEDCQERCVYCDALLSENGNEGFHLDHFRPYVYFSEFKNNPNNLVLACPKCNIFKSKNWPIKPYFHVYASHDGISGFADPFQEQLSSYFDISPSGQLSPKNTVAKYMIELLHLNRESRIQLRRKRSIFHKAIQLNDLVDKDLENLDNYMKSDSFDLDTARTMVASLRRAKTLLTQALEAIHIKN